MTMMIVEKTMGVLNMISVSVDFRLLLLVMLTFMIVMLILQRPINLPPGPWCLPVVGYLPNLAWHSRWYGLPFPVALSRLSQRFGSLYSLYLGDQLCVVLSDKKVIQEAFMNPHLNDRPIATHVKDVNDAGILNASGSNWKAQRAFTLGVFRLFGVGKDSFEGKICSEVECLLQSFEENKRAFNPTPLVCTAISNIMTSVTMAQRYEHANPECTDLLQFADHIFKLSGAAGFKNIVKFLRCLPSRANQKLAATKAKFGSIIDGHVKRRMKTFNAENIECLVDVYFSKLYSKSGISSHINDGTVKKTIASLFIAGTDTTSFQILWVLIYLLRHPEIKDKVKDEIDQVVGRNRLPCLADKAQMPYTQAVILEIMRMTTLVPMGVMHSASADTTLRGYTIPRGTLLLANLWWVHNDPNTWQEPTKFDPGRFLDDHGDVEGEDKIISFSTGRRVCLGENLAKMELFLFVTRILHQFDLDIPEGEPPPSLEGNFALNYTTKPFLMTATKRM